MARKAARKAGNAPASEAAAAAAAATTTAAMKSGKGAGGAGGGFLSAFWQLASSSDGSARETAAEEIETHCAQCFSASREAVPDVEGDSDGDDEEKQEQQDQEQQEEGGDADGDALQRLPVDVAYALKRLVRGLASSREGARMGFAMGLTRLLMHTVCPVVRETAAGSDTGRSAGEGQAAVVTLLAAVWRMVVKSTRAGGGEDGSEERDLWMGRVFGALAVLRALNVDNAEGGDDDEPQEQQEAELQLLVSVAEELCTLHAKRRWMREIATDALLELLGNTTMRRYRGHQARPEHMQEQEHEQEDEDDDPVRRLLRALAAVVPRLEVMPLEDCGPEQAMMRLGLLQLGLHGDATAGRARSSDNNNNKKHNKKGKKKNQKKHSDADDHEALTAAERIVAGLLFGTSATPSSREALHTACNAAQSRILAPENAAAWTAAFQASSLGYPKIHQLWHYLSATLCGASIVPPSRSVTGEAGQALNMPRLEQFETPEQEQRLRAIWQVVDQTMLRGTSHDRKALILDFAPRILRVLPASAIPIVVTRSFVRLIVTSICSPKRYLHYVAKHALEECTKAVSDDSRTRLAFASALVSQGDVHFDKRCQTNTIATLLQDMSPQDADAYISTLEDTICGGRRTAFPDDEGANADDADDAAAARDDDTPSRLRALDALCALVKQNELPHHTLIRRRVVLFLLTVGAINTERPLSETSAVDWRNAASADHVVRVPLTPATTGNDARGQIPTRALAPLPSADQTKHSQKKKQKKQKRKSKGGEQDQAQEDLAAAARDNVLLLARIPVNPDPQQPKHGDRADDDTEELKDQEQDTFEVQELARTRVMGLISDATSASVRVDSSKGDDTSVPSDDPFQGEGGMLRFAYWCLHSLAQHFHLRLWPSIAVDAAAEQWRPWNRSADDSSDDEDEDDDDEEEEDGTELAVALTLASMRVAQAMRCAADEEQPRALRNVCDAFVRLNLHVALQLLVLGTAYESALSTLSEWALSVLPPEFRRDENGDDDDDEDGDDDDDSDLGEHGVDGDEADLSTLLAEACLSVLGAGGENIRGLREAVRRLWTAALVRTPISRETTQLLLETICDVQDPEDGEGEEEEEEDYEEDSDRDEDAARGERAMEEEHGKATGSDSGSDSDSNSEEERDEEIADTATLMRLLSQSGSSDLQLHSSDVDMVGDEDENLPVDAPSSAMADRALAEMLRLRHSGRRSGVLTTAKSGLRHRLRALDLLDGAISKCGQRVMFFCVARPLISCLRQLQQSELLRGTEEAGAFLQRLDNVISTKLVKTRTALPTDADGFVQQARDALALYHTLQHIIPEKGASGSAKDDEEEDNGKSDNDDAEDDDDDEEEEIVLPESVEDGLKELDAACVNDVRALMGFLREGGALVGVSGGAIFAAVRTGIALSSYRPRAPNDTALAPLGEQMQELAVDFTTKRSSIQARFFEELAGRFPERTIQWIGPQLVFGCKDGRNVFVRTACFNILGTLLRRANSVTTVEGRAQLIELVSASVQAAIALISPDATASADGAQALRVKHVRPMLTLLQALTQVLPTLREYAAQATGEGAVGKKQQKKGKKKAKRAVADSTTQLDLQPLVDATQTLAAHAPTPLVRVCNQMLGVLERAGCTVVEREPAAQNGGLVAAQERPAKQTHRKRPRSAGNGDVGDDRDSDSDTSDDGSDADEGDGVGNDTSEEDAVAPAAENGLSKASKKTQRRKKRRKLQQQVQQRREAAERTQGGIDSDAGANGGSDNSLASPMEVVAPEGKAAKKTKPSKSKTKKQKRKSGATAERA